MTTIRDIAHKVGLSVGTVSKAIRTPEKVSPANLEKINAAVKELNYKPNMLSQVFRTKKNNTIIVMVANLANAYLINLVSAIEKIAEPQGYEIMIADTRYDDEREKKYIEMVETSLALGVINLRAYSPQQKYFPTANITAVSAGSSLHTPYPAVGIDNAKAAEDMARHLLSLGHRQIGLITGQSFHAHTRDRKLGFLRAIASAGAGTPIVAEGKFDFATGYTAAMRILEAAARPTAIFCMNDLMAIGAIKALNDNGLTVPGDISVAGFDDQACASYCIPALTTVAQPVDAMAEAAMALFLANLKKHSASAQEPDATPENIILPYKLMVRDSTCKPRF